MKDDELDSLEGIKRGLADVEAGRVTTLEDFEREFKAQRGLLDTCSPPSSISPTSRPKRRPVD
jgi:hypothetical protein